MPVHETGTGPPVRRAHRVTEAKQRRSDGGCMEPHTVDTVPLFIARTARCTEYVVRIDERRGSVHLDPAP